MTSLAHYEALASATELPGRALIDGQSRPSVSGKTFDNITSRNGTVINRIASCDVADVDAAVASSRAAFEDGRWRKLHYREKKRILFGLADLMERDVETLAPHVARSRKTIVVEFRGRGESAYAKDPMTYVPLTYVQDVVALLDELEIARFATIGTSLGGLVSMLMAVSMTGRLVGAVLNDVGPELEAKGLERIRDYIGAGGGQPTWIHAARAFAELNAAVYQIGRAHV